MMYERGKRCTVPCNPSKFERTLVLEKGLDEIWQSERIFHFPFVFRPRAPRNALSAASSIVFRFLFLGSQASDVGSVHRPVRFHVSPKPLFLGSGPSPCA